MKRVGELLKECRKDATPIKITLRQVADIVQLDISLVGKIESGKSDYNLNRIQAERLAQLFRKRKIAEVKIQEFMQACDLEFSTSKLISEVADWDFLKLIYGELRELKEEERQAYIKELLIHFLRDLDRDTVFYQENSALFEARLKLESSRILQYQGQNAIAAKALTEAVELSRKESNKYLWAEVLKETGDFVRQSKQENLLSAIEYYERAYEIYRNHLENFNQEPPLP